MCDKAPRAAGGGGTASDHEPAQVGLGPKFYEIKHFHLFKGPWVAQVEPYRETVVRKLFCE